jgi:formylglycine-generating enzyme required for sulfatase activity
MNVLWSLFALACCNVALADDEPLPLNVRWSVFAIACSHFGPNDTVPEFDALTLHSQSGVSLDFVYIPPGDYIVGRNVGFDSVMARLGLEGNVEEGPRRYIEFENGFYLGQYQVTAEQFATFLNDVDPAIAEKSIVFNRFSNLMRDSDGVYGAIEGASRHPANTVTWEGAVEFTKWFTQETGWSVRLPTEDEWEAAARTAWGFSWPTGGVQEIDPERGPTRPRAGNGDADVDAFASNVTANGLWHTLSSVGDWTSDVYVSDRGERWPDTVFAEYDGDGHVLKRCLNDLCEREPGGEVGSSGVYGMRVLLEADESGSPLRAETAIPID